MLRFDKMTVKAQEALQEAQEIAARHENQAVEPLHLLSALIQQQDGVVPPLLARLGIRSEAISQDIEREISRLPKVQGFAQQHLGRALNDVLENSFEEATKFKDEYETALKTLVRRKASGKPIKAAEREEKPDNVVSLMDALKQSLKQKGSGRRGSHHPASRRSSARRPAKKAHRSAARQRKAG